MNAFLELSGHKAKHYPDIWRDRCIQKDTAEMRLAEAAATRAINQQNHLSDNLDKLLEVECG